jgi:Uma2 family endonuclease
MTSVLLQKTSTKAQPISIDHESNGRLLTPREFDRADFEDGWHYELINGVLIVSPIPSNSETDPNEQLGHWLRTYQEQHPQGSHLDRTLPEQTVRIGSNRRRLDRCIWAGLGRRPKRHERPTIAVEFVSAGKRNRHRDYVVKRKEYLRIKVKEYWIIDRFDRSMVVFTRRGGKTRCKVIKENQVYTTPLLPGFELPLAQLLALADDWAVNQEESD